jgi:putative polyketide hydroxylase
MDIVSCESSDTLKEFPILIVGGSLVGLSAAVFLAWRGVPVVLVEPHAGSHPHPRAMGYTPRTLELFRAVGIAHQIPEVPPDFSLRRATVESLAGAWQAATDWTPRQEGAAKARPLIEHSPHSGAGLAQDLLEPILRDRARQLGAELRLGTELVRFEQDKDGVTAVLREHGGKESTLRASYMIAADGSKSSVREALGIERRGPGHMRTVRSVLFRAPLDQYLKRGISQFEIDQPELKAFLTTYNDGRWVLMFVDEVERDEAGELAAIRRAIGQSDVSVEVITRGRWDLSALVAERFSLGRVFLAGDAAHTLPPTRGGFGANTGIADAYDLAWKLEAVLTGVSRPDLLETYDAERRPVAWTRLEQTLARPDYARHAKQAVQVPLLGDAALEFGQLYRSGAIVGAGPELPAAAEPETWAGQPGTRAPHFVGEADKGSARSTLDLFGRGWVLVAADPRWKAALEPARALGIPLTLVLIGEDFRPADPKACCAAFGLTMEGASLVRPDGFIAWRAPQLPARPEQELARALSQVAAPTETLSL